MNTWNKLANLEYCSERDIAPQEKGRTLLQCQERLAKLLSHIASNNSLAQSIYNDMAGSQPESKSTECAAPSPSGYIERIDYLLDDLERQISRNAVCLESINSRLG